MRTPILPAAGGLFACFMFGCLTPEKAETEADETARELATSCWQAQLAGTNTFDIARPAHALTFRLALEALRTGRTAVFPKVPAVSPLVPSNGVVHLGLRDALALGAYHNRKYQTLKETVYTKALLLDTQRYAFDTTFTGLILGTLEGNPELTETAGGLEGGATKKFEQGSTIAGNLALDVAKMIRDDWHSFAWTGDLTMKIPLLRGAGRDIVREPLTQAERNLLYALLNFDRYRQTYALSVSKAYFNVLKYAQTHRNSGDNAHRLELNWKRAEMMFRAGRMDRIQSDQAKTDLLSARQTTITTRQSYEAALDDFKILLGLPPESPIALREDELTRLEADMARLAKEQTDALTEFPAEDTALNIALTERRDLAVTRGELADAERAVLVAADALRADLTVEGGGSYDADRYQHQNVDETIDTVAKLKFSAPWDRRKERNAYRNTLIALAQAQRSLQEDEDEIKNAVRSGYRDLVAARVLYENKVESWKTACLRVEANDLFTQSGRSTMRDILEAESALLTARNSLCSAVIDWKMARLTLRTALGLAPGE